MANKIQFDEWIEWLNTNNIQVNIKHEDFKEYYNNLDTPELNLHNFNMLNNGE